MSSSILVPVTGDGSGMTRPPMTHNNIDDNINLSLGLMVHDTNDKMKINIHGSVTQTPRERYPSTDVEYVTEYTVVMFPIGSTLLGAGEGAEMFDALNSDEGEGEKMDGDGLVKFVISGHQFVALVALVILLLFVLFMHGCGASGSAYMVMFFAFVMESSGKVSNR